MINTHYESAWQVVINLAKINECRYLEGLNDNRDVIFALVNCIEPIFYQQLLHQVGSVDARIILVPLPVLKLDVKADSPLSVDCSRKLFIEHSDEVYNLLRSLNLVLLVLILRSPSVSHL